jgi:hypothetical protein
LTDFIGNYLTYFLVLLYQCLICEMQKDKRYGIVKKLVNSGQVTTFSEVLAIVPKTVICLDLKMHHFTFKKIIKDPERLTLKDISRLASLIEIDKREFVKLIFNEGELEKPKKRKKSKTGIQKAQRAAKKR